MRKHKGHKYLIGIHLKVITDIYICLFVIDCIAYPTSCTYCEMFEHSEIDDELSFLDRLRPTPPGTPQTVTHPRSGPRPSQADTPHLLDTVAARMEGAAEHPWHPSPPVAVQQGRTYPKDDHGNRDASEPNSSEDEADQAEPWRDRVGGPREGKNRGHESQREGYQTRGTDRQPWVIDLTNPTESLYWILPLAQCRTRP